MDPARCSIHGLIVAADGRCVICRRGDADTEVPEKTVSDATWMFVIGGVLLAGMGAFVLYVDPFHARSTAPEGGASTQLNVAPTPTEAPPPPPPPHRPPVFITDAPASTAAAIASAAVDPADAKKAALDAAKKQVQIKIYTKAGDAMTASVHKFLAKRGLTYTELDIGQSDTDRIEMTSLNPSGSIPTLIIDGAVVTQMDADEIDDVITRAAQARVAAQPHS